MYVGGMEVIELCSGPGDTVRGGGLAPPCRVYDDAGTGECAVATIWAILAGFG